MNKNILLLSLLLVSGSSASADVTYSATGLTVGGTSSPLYTDAQGFNHYLITVVSNPLDPVGGSVQIESDDSYDVIDEIVVYNNASGTRYISISISDSSGNQTSFASVSKIHAADCNDTDINIENLKIPGDILAEGPNSIYVNSISEIDIEGSLYGRIIIEDGASGLVPLSGVNTINIDGDVVRGGVYSQAGDITSIAIGGNVVSDTSVGIRSEIWSSGSIGVLQVDGDLDGRVGINGLSYNGECFNITSNIFSDIDTLQIGGDFTGGRFMQVGSLNNLSVAGDFDVKININSVMADTSVYDIAGTMDTDARIYLPSDGLEGQVIINSGDNGDSWDGNVYVNTTPLSPDYTNLSDELGGGAVGVAPFNFHQRDTAPPANVNPDCDPYHHEVKTVPAIGDDPVPSVELEHYGPVYIVNEGNEAAAGEHFIVEFKPDYQTGSPQWFDRSDQFVVTSAGTVSSPMRKIVITKSDSKGTGFHASGHWRITPVQNKVLCGDVDGNPPVEYYSDVYATTVSTTLTPQTNYWYTFRVLQEAPESLILNSGNGPSSTDLSIWLQTPYETNGDGEIDSNDFNDMVEHYSE